MSANDGKKKNEKKSGGAGGATDVAVKEWTDSLEADYQRIWSVGEECVTESELKKLLLSRTDTEQSVVLYDGFEPSGRMHIAQGIFKAMNVNKCTQMVTPNLKANFVFWVADWFALMNDKMGGDLNKIKIVGEYLQQVWGAAGMDISKVTFLWASDEITNKANVYWPLMLDITRRFNITRIKKCCQIMGRLEGSLTAAQILYPLMQATDVFFLKSDICQLGVDQRKVNMLAREYCDHAKRKHKPIILSHHMLFGLKKGQEKMSKSDPDSAIFMEDSVEDVHRKIMNAYCPSVEEEATEQQSGQADDAGKESMHLIKDDLKNPCLDYIEYIIFSSPNATFTVSSGKVYTEFVSIRDDFLDGIVNEAQLKGGLIDALNVLLEPVREHFTQDENAKNLLAQVQQFKKESKTIVKDKVIRRLNMVELGKVEKDCFVVFAPLPVANPALQDAADVYFQLQHAVKEKKAQSSVVLFLSDWSAKVCSACDADVKVINSFYTVFLTALKALDTGLIMDNVQIIYQSEAILSDPSNYWISVINIGRHFSLKDVMGNKMKDSDNAGIVISRLMFVADIMGLQPKYVSLLNSSSLIEKDTDVEKLLISNYFKDDKLATLETPTVILFGDSSSTTEDVIKRPALRLQQERELEAHKTENDEYFLLDDPKIHGKSKMKKAFCEPGNVTFCPPISLASAFTFDIGGGTSDDQKSILIKRSDENGGDITFKNQDEITESFKSSSLHPGDLKASSTLIMVSTLEKLSTAIKADKDTLKASKALKAYQKKKNKQQSQKKK